MAQAPIITFYSYKGGTGRSMGLANTAWILASNGMRVLALDWDLEAPGLHRFFHPFLPDKNLSFSDGVIDLMWDFVTAAADPEAEHATGWHEKLAVIPPYVMSVEYPFPKRGTIDLVPAGRQNHLYAKTVTSFDWTNFYENLGGGGFLEALKRSMRADYDYVLIDSRTGLSDTAGICTVQLPDILVDCFSLSTQAIDGAAAVATSVHRQRGAQQLRIFPIPMRVEDGEQDKLDASRDYARAQFGPFLSHIPDPERYWGEVEVPYRRYYAYEEILATIGDRPQQVGTILAVTERIVGYLTADEVTRLGSPVPEQERRRLLALFQRGRTSEHGRADRQVAGSPRVFISFAYDSAEQFEAIRDLWYLLRGRGVDARLDLAPGQRDQDWPGWQADQVRQAQVVLVVASPGYRQSQAIDTDPIGDAYRADPRRFIAVVLPRGSAADVPEFLERDEAEVVSVTALTADGIEPVVRRIERLVPAPLSDQRLPESSWYKQLRKRSVDLAVASAADDLGRVVFREWQAYLRASGQLDPFPLPVRWSSSTKQTAAVAPPQSPISGTVAELGDAFMSLPRGRMVLLGAPGSGKTTAVVQLALSLLDQREVGSATPIPVLTSPASWNPDAESLDVWMARRLRVAYGLAGDTSDRLIRTGMIMPVLDSLDELPGSTWLSATSELERHSVSATFVVTARMDEYEQEVRTTGRAISGATVLVLEPLDLADAIAYLSASAVSDDHRWQKFFTEAGGHPDAPALRALRTPQYLWLARERYRSPLTDPTELLRLPNRTAVERDLVGTLFASYERAPSTSNLGPSNSADKARRWLTFIARYLRARHSDALAVWELPEALPTVERAALFGLAGLPLVAGAVALGYFLASLVTVTSRLSLLLGLSFAIAVLANAVARAAVPPQSRSRSWRILPGPRSPDKADPRGVLRASRRAALTALLAAGMAGGAAVATVLAHRKSGWLAPGLTGAALTAVETAVPLLWLSVWIRYVITKIWLGSRGLLPLRLVVFLEGARRQGLLRRTGAVYRFRYAALQDLFAGDSSQAARRLGSSRHH